MTLVAPSPVLRALYEFQDDIRASNHQKTQTKHDEALARLLREIRKDVHPNAPDDAGLTFG
jgi:hypothetical protein